MKFGIIYKIYCPAKPKTRHYIGSTTQKLKTRLSHHRTNLKSYIKGDYHYTCSFHLMKYEIDGFLVKIKKIEKFYYDDVKDLRKREKQIINKLNCQNKLKKKKLLKITDYLIKKNKIVKKSKS